MGGGQGSPSVSLSRPEDHIRDTRRCSGTNIWGHQVNTSKKTATLNHLYTKQSNLEPGEGRKKDRRPRQGRGHTNGVTGKAGAHSAQRCGARDRTEQGSHLRKGWEPRVASSQEHFHQRRKSRKPAGAPRGQSLPASSVSGPGEASRPSGPAAGPRPAVPRSSSGFPARLTVCSPELGLCARALASFCAKSLRTNTTGMKGHERQNGANTHGCRGRRKLTEPLSPLGLQGASLLGTRPTVLHKDRPSAENLCGHSRTWLVRIGQTSSQQEDHHGLALSQTPSGH